MDHPYWSVRILTRVGPQAETTLLLGTLVGGRGRGWAQPAGRGGTEVLEQLAADPLSGTGQAGEGHFERAHDYEGHSVVGSRNAWDSSIGLVVVVIV